MFTSRGSNAPKVQELGGSDSVRRAREALGFLAAPLTSTTLVPEPLLDLGNWKGPIMIAEHSGETSGPDRVFKVKRQIECPQSDWLAQLTGEAN